MIGTIAIAFGTINIVGGFMVTDRMLGMFSRKPKPKARRRRRRRATPDDPLAVLEPGGDGATALYIVAFSLFIIGVKQGTHPTTAKRGNLIAAVGMAVAVVTTLLLDGIGNWGLIALGLGIGAAVGVDRLDPRADDRDAADGRPLQRRRRRRRRADRLVGDPPRDLARRGRSRSTTLIPILFAAVVGSVSFWGSNIAFAKLQDLIPTRPLAVPGPAGDQRASC